jgi:centromere protein C
VYSKTGITLKDTGVRDKHGLEPVSGIFSSPASPEQHGNRTLTSEGMEMQESAYIKSEEEASASDEELMTRTRPGSAPDVTATLTNRKTPRTLARTSPLKRTTIGGTPRRMSSARPQSHAPHPSEDPETSPPVHGIVNRQLNFGLAHRERKSQPGPGTDSPFKPRHKIRRSTGTGRSDIYDLETEEGAGQTNDIAEGDETVEQSIEGDDEEPVLLEDPVEEDYTVQSVEEVATEAPSKRKRGRPRKSDQSNATSIDTGSPFVAPAPAAPIPSSSGTKRHRTSLENDDVPSARKRKRAPNASVVTVRRDDEEETIDPSLIAHGDEYVENVDNYEEEQPQLDSQLNANEEFEPEPEPEPVKKGRGRPKGKTSKAAAPKERDPNRAIQPRESPRKLTDSPSRNRGRGASAGPVSNVNLRAHTPALDAGNRASRTGRNLIAPLKFWENESRIWRNGEIEGIIRAEPVDVSRPKPKRKKRGRPNKHSLDDIEEESETESVMPDEWEDEMGVITGNVASWNADLKQGDPEDPYQEGMQSCLMRAVDKASPLTDSVQISHSRLRRSSLATSRVRTSNMPRS